VALYSSKAFLNEKNNLLASIDVCNDEVVDDRGKKAYIGEA
jgi:hypothetical protein